eukprot:gene16013-16199_t
MGTPVEVTRGLVSLGIAAELADATVKVGEATGFEECQGTNRQQANVYAFGFPGKDHGPLLLEPVGGAGWTQVTDGTDAKGRHDFYQDVGRALGLTGTLGESAIALKTGPDGAFAFIQPATGLKSDRALGHWLGHPVCLVCPSTGWGTQGVPGYLQGAPSAAAARGHHDALVPDGDDGFDARQRLSTPRPQAPAAAPPGAGVQGGELKALVEASRNCVEAVGTLVASRPGAVAAQRDGDEEKDGGAWNDAMDALERALGSGGASCIAGCMKFQLGNRKSVYRHPKYHLLQWGQGSQLAWPSQLDAFVQDPEEIHSRAIRRRFKALAAGQDDGSRAAISKMINCLMADTVLLDEGVAEDDDARAEAELRRRRGLVERWTRADGVSTARESTRLLTRSFESRAEEMKRATKTSAAVLTAPPGEGGYRHALDDFAIMAPGAARQQQWGRGRGGGGGQSQQSRRGFGPNPGAGEKARKLYENSLGKAPDAKRARQGNGASNGSEQGKRCFHCNQKGHLQRACPYKKLSREEARSTAAEPDLPGPEYFQP